MIGLKVLCPCLAWGLGLQRGRSQSSHGDQSKLTEAYMRRIDRVWWHG